MKTFKRILLKWIYSLPLIRTLVSRIKELEKNVKMLQSDNNKLKKQNEKLKQSIKSVKRQSVRDKKELQAEISYNYYRNFPEERYEEGLKEWFYGKNGFELNLENPQTFNEKIQWIKLYDCCELKTKLTDKFLVRDYVKEKVGEKYLIPLLGVYDSFQEINFDELPNQFVMKANHGCKWNIIVKDKETFNTIEAEKKFRKWMSTNFAFRAGFELQYRDIVPKIVVEKYLENRDGGLDDYKVFCFDGKAKYIQYITNREQGKTKMAFYDLEWNLMPFISNGRRVEHLIQKPYNLDKIISLSETLSEGFHLVRVDFYVLADGSIKFGELTFTPASGLCKWDPVEYNEIIGEMIHLPI